MIEQHIQIRNPLVFGDVACYLADTIGSRVSVSKIENRLSSVHRKTSAETIERYLQALVDAFLFYRLRRFDVKGGAYLQGLEKYYAADLGIKNMLLGFPEKDCGFDWLIEDARGSACHLPQACKAAHVIRVWPQHTHPRLGLLDKTGRRACRLACAAARSFWL